MASGGGSSYCSLFPTSTTTTCCMPQSSLAWTGLPSALPRSLSLFTRALRAILSTVSWFQSLLCSKPTYFAQKSQWFFRWHRGPVMCTTMPPGPSHTLPLRGYLLPLSPHSLSSGPQASRLHRKHASHPSASRSVLRCHHFRAVSPDHHIN